MNKLVEHLVKHKVLKSEKVIQVMSKVDRGDYISGWGAYDDTPQPIGFNATISAPHMHAYCLEWLKDALVPGAKALDIGCGSGYLCAAFYELMDGKGKVVGVEHLEGLCQLSSENLSKNYKQQLQNKQIEIVCRDGRLGYPEEAPYDVIHVGASNFIHESLWVIQVHRMFRSL